MTAPRSLPGLGAGEIPTAGAVNLTPPHANAKPKNKSQVLILESPEQIKAWGFFYDKNIMPQASACGLMDI